MRRSLPLLIVMLALACAAAALAGVRAGYYRGQYGHSRHGSKVTFTVTGSSLRNFHAFVPAYCFTTNTFVFQTFYVPRARIRSGKVKTTYVVRDNRGQALGRDRLTADFGRRGVTGTLGASEAGCTVATYHWTAHRG